MMPVINPLATTEASFPRAQWGGFNSELILGSRWDFLAKQRYFFATDIIKLN
jgi:hypothetical protein